MYVGLEGQYDTVQSLKACSHKMKTSFGCICLAQENGIFAFADNIDPYLEVQAASDIHSLPKHRRLSEGYNTLTKKVNLKKKSADDKKAEKIPRGQRVSKS